MRPFAIVSTDEKMHDAGLPTMSADTRSSSEYSSTPRYDGSTAALANTSLISSMVAGFARFADRSVIEPVGTGTRSAAPSSLPLSSGSTRPIARAAPELFGMIDSAADRMRRRSGLPLRVALARSTSDWSLVYACTVVIRPCSMPKVSLSTLASGARQFVVHDAFEITVCALGVVDAVVDAHADRSRRRRRSAPR